MIDQRLTEIIDCLYRVAVKAVIVRDGKLLLSKEEVKNHPELKLRGFPGGGIDYGEDFQKGLMRELREELHLNIKPEQISEQPIQVSFGKLTDGKFSENRNIPTILFYYSVKLSENQQSTAGENDFEWVDVRQLEKVNFVSQTANDREFLINYLNDK
ncbi:MAG: NUDIX domain-containing protein [Streptococcaceae bacterium]|jgi:ADP-ribose pyrophosphatase YjhB (NUDIX family)|nr:NUDIX domain-containing protein [Streptococcaceae bacterium]